ncbi:MAG: pseudaminic acid synthase [Candidatus Lindowbacteria bacterium RIFCSPLOWO2_12_FULL_62_27]|nr:MAG: pseudaminic acid synthase [Candidatus Lindowbacteria bacterium RIFCSPLOWO2_02_FULL_62_12]OGH62701.1 MAG: pseudaminic acid synthase [Candidatus Lindowbacteria bacterium RIFCSPLOWO2_12_FULL_62_27]
MPPAPQVPASPTPAGPVYIVAELSANHLQKLDVAFQLIDAAMGAGANAVKIQTFTPDTITFDSKSAWFQLPENSPWRGRTLYDLYQKAYLPWDWHPRLKQKCEEVGIDFFSTPFDETAVDFLERLGVSLYKIASFEIVDLNLLEHIGRTRKPVIVSTGMATRDEIQEAVVTLDRVGAREIALLKCTSAYPAALDQMNLRTLADMQAAFHRPVGLSDHTLGSVAAVTAVALGATIIEKHLTLSRSLGGPDAAFSMEPAEFKQLVQSVRETERAMGGVRYGPNEDEEVNIRFRPSIFAVRAIHQGEAFGSNNIKTIRPGHGLPCRYYPSILGRTASRNIDEGTPLSWEMIENGTG